MTLAWPLNWTMQQQQHQQHGGSLQDFFVRTPSFLSHPFIYVSSPLSSNPLSEAHHLHLLLVTEKLDFTFHYLIYLRY